MAKKKQVSLVDRLEHAAGDVADALSVAATGSQIGVLELAAEDELGIKPVKPGKKKVAVKKKAAPKKAVSKTKAAPRKPVKKAKRKKSRR